jgi:hypothetical protein
MNVRIHIEAIPESFLATSVPRVPRTIHTCPRW